MNTVTSGQLEKGDPTAAGLAALAEMPPTQQEVARDRNERMPENHNSDARTEGKRLAPLFLQDVAAEFSTRWDARAKRFCR